MEAGQLINRHLIDLGTIDPALLTDVPYNNYLDALRTRSALYGQAVAQIQKNAETLKIADADQLRDNAVRAFASALKLYGYSDVAAEREAARELGIIYKSLKDITTMNYEAETQAIAKLLSELAKPAAAANVATLGISRWVTFLQTSNQAFANLFGSRIQTEAVTETYDMKVVRKETFKLYTEFCDYLLSMGKATNGQLFVKALNLVNAGRSYYADLIARRDGNKDNGEEASS